MVHIIFSWLFLISSGVILLMILGTYLADTFKGSKFDKWWKRNVITQIPDDYED